MSVRRISGASVAVVGLVLLTAWLFRWPLEKAVYLAPVIVVCAAALAGLGLLWGRVVVEQLRGSSRPRLVLALWLAGIALIIVLTVLGVELPRE